MQEKDLYLKKTLKEVWNAFFSKFGKLLVIQREVIPEVLNRNNLIIVSPAATGKTEAVCAPITRLLLDQKWQGLSVLYISPTRALVNDLYKRIEPPLNRLSITISIKTADKPQFDANKPTSFLITTPEGFDSCLCRYPEVFKDVRVVILDEIHLYDNTARGDALRVLLNRLRLLIKHDINYYALSATISSPYNLAKKYFDKFKIIISRKTREITYKLLPYTEDLRLLWEELREKNMNKILIFCKTRKETEITAMKLKKLSSYPEKIYIHHASLSHKERELVEKRLNNDKTGIVIATTTLEVGIDIGDIDCIVFTSAPVSVASLLQRLGRGNRREDKVYAFAIYKNEFEKMLYELLFYLASIGWCEETTYTPHISILPQQILSYIVQRRNIGTTITSLERIFSNILPITKEDIKSIISHLIELNYIRSVRYDILTWDDRLYSLFRRGNLHSNIERYFEYQVVDINTSKVIGHIENLTPTFILAGKIWSSEKVENNTIYAKQQKFDSEYIHDDPFIGRGSALWNWRLGHKLKIKLFSNICDSYMDNLEYILFYTREKVWYVYHFLGLVYGYIWQETLHYVKKDIKIYDVEGMYFISKDLTCITDILNISKEEIRETLRKKRRNIANFLNLGGWYHLLPENLKEKAIEYAFSIDTFYNIIKKLKPVELTFTKIRKCLQG